MSPNAIMAVATSTQLLLPHAQGGDPHRDLGCRHVRREPAFARNRPKSPQTTPHSIRIDDHFRPTECLIAPVLFRSMRSEWTGGVPATLQLMGESDMVNRRILFSLVLSTSIGLVGGIALAKNQHHS